MKKNVKKEKIICSIVFILLFLLLAFILYDTKDNIITTPWIITNCICYPSDDLIKILNNASLIMCLISPIVGLIILLINKKNYLLKAFIAFGIFLLVIPYLLSFIGDSIHDYEVNNELGHPCKCEK